MERRKQERIDKLKNDLETVEERYKNQINANSMLGEDHRSVAMRNFNNLVVLKVKMKEKLALIKTYESDIEVNNFLLSKQEK
jgi:hypothetical protein